MAVAAPTSASRSSSTRARAVLLWVHYAPPLNDSFRVSYRQLLRWNDELPFVKFALSDDERPVLTAELPVAGLDRDALGLAVCRLLAVCDLTARRARGVAVPGRTQRAAHASSLPQEALFERYRGRPRRARRPGDGEGAIALSDDRL